MTPVVAVVAAAESQKGLFLRRRRCSRVKAESTGESQMAIDKMVEGRLRKYFEEVVLMEQKFIMDDTLYIEKVLDKLSKEVGSTVKIGSFLRVEVGQELN